MQVTDAMKCPIHANIVKRTGSRVQNLTVTETPEGVILTGHASTFHAKQLAQHGVMDLGLPVLENGIEVL